MHSSDLALLWFAALEDHEVGLRSVRSRGHSRQHFLARQGANHSLSSQSVPQSCLQVVWVVGASSGIGAGVAVRAAAAGATVLASARREDRLQQLANDFSSVNASSNLPGTIIPTPLDCTDRDACAEIVQKIVAEHGRIDIALLNAGAGAGRHRITHRTLCRHAYILVSQWWLGWSQNVWPRT